MSEVQMIELDRLRQLLSQTALKHWLDSLDDDLSRALSARTHGDETRWQQALVSLMPLSCERYDMSSGSIDIMAAMPLEHEKKHLLEQQLQAFIPWRKGPFNIHGVAIDTEWRSDWKWQRLVDHISDLKDRLVLDVGCGSGYHGWRMADSGAQLVVGIDPGRLFYYQYRVIEHFLRPFSLPFFMLPMGIEHLSAGLRAFDTVFSMGVLYHRKSPIEHLEELRGCLRPGGELVLETLIVEAADGYALMPEKRYAKMRNVWFIPSTGTLETWLRRCGFRDIRLVDVTKTSLEEQRSTDWMRFESLADFLDPADAGKTIEGYPAPVRAIVIATAP